MLSVKSYSFQVSPQDVDFQCRINMASLVNILLNAAGYNADDHGFGLRRLNSMGSSWVLLRLAVEMDYFPEQYEQISVETWVEEVGHATTTRNFSIRDSKGKVIGNACSNWAMIDMETRRAKDLQALEGIHDFASGIRSRIGNPIKLESVEGRQFDGFRVKYSDIDINGHVNSSRYIQWISDCFSLDRYRTDRIKRFEINYMNEMLYDDPVLITGVEKDFGDFRFEILKNGRAACRARVVFDRNSLN